MEDRTGGCCRSLGRAVGRGDRLIKLGDSWFSTKPVEAGPMEGKGRVERCWSKGLSKGTDGRTNCE